MTGNYAFVNHPVKPLDLSLIRMKISDQLKIYRNVIFNVFDLILCCDGGQIGGLVTWRLWVQIQVLIISFYR